MRSRHGASDMFANRGEDITDRRHRMPSRRDHLIFQVECLGEQRIGIVRKPSIRIVVGLRGLIGLRDDKRRAARGDCRRRGSNHHRRLGARKHWL